MFKKLISSILIVGLIVGIFIVANPLTSTKVNAEDYREGFSLTPDVFDSTGVNPNSFFILKSQVANSLANIQKILKNDNQLNLSITQIDKFTFKVQPLSMLEQNKLYTFRISQKGQTDITWTFQTTATFKIAGVFPADKSTGVPTNSGIEIYFSHDSYQDLSGYFEITPKVSGTFERHKKAMVFVPSSLSKGTLYTITIKKGLKLDNSDRALTQDFTFSFETEVDQKQQENLNYKGYISYNRLFGEYTPREKPFLPINYYVNDNNFKDNTLKVSTKIYAYKDIDSFIEAIGKKDSTPNWAYYSYLNNIISINGLAEVASFEQSLNAHPKYSEEQYITIPKELPVGYYLVDSKWENINFQTLIQVTDISMYVTKADNKTLVWLNDLLEKKPVSAATVTDLSTGKSYKTDNQGIAYFNTPWKTSSEDQNQNDSSRKILKITSSTGKTALLNIYSYQYWDYYGGNTSSLYWDYLQLDRNLYKPDDKVNLWGFVKNRYESEKIDEITLELSQGYGYYPIYRSAKSSKVSYDGDRFFPYQTQTILTQKLKVKDGVFKDEFQLPNLSPGGYQLTLKKDGKMLSSSYVNVQNYTKPAYMLEASSDKNAIFSGEKVNFNVKGSFFEGTGVPNLDVNYNINGSFGDKNVQGNLKTNSKGELNISYTPEASNNVQGEQYLGLYAHSTLPEIGEISQNASVRVFVNDINVAISGEYKDKKAKISATVNKIVLDRLNNGTAKDYSDFLGDAVQSKTITGTIYRNWWEQYEVGQYYDYVNKVTQKRYEYRDRHEVVTNFSMITGVDGKASISLDLPELKEGYYNVKLNCQDSTGKKMNFETYLWNGWNFDYNYYNDTRYYLDGGKEKYKSGENVKLTFKKGKVALPQGSYLFMKLQNGIREYELSSSSDHSFQMKDTYVPNISVQGVFFNGLTYVSSEALNIAYDYSDKKITLDAKLDKQTYKPGEQAVINISIKDVNGKPVKAAVNASIVDEALFNLQDQQIDTLAQLYTYVSSGITFTYESHKNSGMDGSGGYGAKDEMLQSKTKSTVSFSQPEMENSRNSMKMDDAYAGADIATREVFKDTAMFETIFTDEKGQGKLILKLPDNVTSWRVTLSGISKELKAGSNKVSLKVSLPFFINYTANTTYLDGDLPTIGVNAYGDSLKDGDDVMFEITSPQLPGKVAKAAGKAFERINLPLWKIIAKDSGSKLDLVIKAKTKSGLGDAIKHSIYVIKTYHEIDTADYYNVKPGLSIKAGNKGNVKLVFTDKSIGMFLPELVNLKYYSGKRIDQQLISYLASGLISSWFKQYDFYNSETSFKASQFQKEDGGIALLPYGESDPEISVRLVKLLKDQIDITRLKQYYYSLLENDTRVDDYAALYALAALHEPVLVEINKAAQIRNLNIKDTIYLSMAYNELGEKYTSEKLYNNEIKSIMTLQKPFYYINTGVDKDDILETTALAALLASSLDKPEKLGLYEYCTHNATKDILVNTEMLTYINQEINKYNSKPLQITYSYEGKSKTKKFEAGETFNLTIPATMLSQLKFDKVQGDISVVVMYKTNTVDAQKLDQNINITRKYFAKDAVGGTKNNFKQNDIIRVELNVKLGAKALDGSYEVTDFLPSGLKPIENIFNFGIQTGRDNYWCKIDGQKVTFYTWNNLLDRTPTMTYYARVITPGTYKADGAIIQSEQSTQSLNITPVDTIHIK